MAKTPAVEVLSDVAKNAQGGRLARMNSGCCSRRGTRADGRTRHREDRHQGEWLQHGPGLPKPTLPIANPQAIDRHEPEQSAIGHKLGETGAYAPPGRYCATDDDGGRSATVQVPYGYLRRSRDDCV